MDSTAPTPGSGGRPYRTELSPVSFLRRSAYVFPDKVAVVHGERRTTYREFDERVNRLASALAAAGVDRAGEVRHALRQHPVPNEQLRLRVALHLQLEGITLRRNVVSPDRTRARYRRVSKGGEASHR